MKRKFFLLLICFFLLVLVALPYQPKAFAEEATKIASGPVGTYKFKAAASWMIQKINLSWVNDGSANSFYIVYGKKPGVYPWGVPNIQADPQKTTTFTIGMLRQDRYYYFLLVAFKDGQYVNTSGPVSALTN